MGLGLGLKSGHVVVGAGWSPGASTITRALRVAGVGWSRSGVRGRGLVARGVGAPLLVRRVDGDNRGVVVRPRRVGRVDLH